MDNGYVVYQSKRKQIGLSFLGMFMVVASFSILVAGIVETQYLLMAIGIIGFLFFRSL